MEPTDLTLEVLESIHTEIRGVREEGRAANGRLDVVTARIDGVAARLDGVTERLDEVVVRADRLERRQVETEVRLAAEIVGVAGAVRELRDLFKDDLSVRRDVREHKDRVVALETRGR
jgi:hypothetical protein